MFKNTIIMIEVEHLTKFYGLVPAISDLSFQVGQGEVVGFLGPNGAGKTTTMKILTCFLPRPRGRPASTVWISPGIPWGSGKKSAIYRKITHFTAK